MTYPTYEDQSSPEDYPDHQLVPQKGGKYIHVFHGPPGTDVGDLHSVIQEDEDGHTVVSSGWRPTDEQVAKLEAGAHIRVALWTYPIPPVAVCLEGPVCPCHGEEMVFNGEDGGYYCAKLPTVGVNGDSPMSALEQAHADFTPESPEDDDD